MLTTGERQRLGEEVYQRVCREVETQGQGHGLIVAAVYDCLDRRGTGDDVDALTKKALHLMERVEA